MASYIGRRKFLATLGGGAAAWPLAARAQQTEKLPTVGFLGATTPSSQRQWTDAFLQRLRELGWTEGRNLAIEYRWAEGRLAISRASSGVGPPEGRCHCHALSRTSARSKARNSSHTNRLPGGGGPGGQRLGRKSVATGRQHHWPIAPVDRSCWQAPRTVPRGSAWCSPTRDRGEYRCSCLHVGNARGTDSG